MAATPDWIQVGRVTKAHGVEGEVRVEIHTDNPDRFSPGSRIYVRTPAGAAGSERPARQEMYVEELRGSGETPILTFREVRGRDEALLMTGALLEIPGSDLPETEEGTYYPFQLEGLEVWSDTGVRLGLVGALLESPANEVLVVYLEDGGESLVPFTEEAVPVVEIGESYLEVRESLMVRTLGRGEKDRPR